MQSVSDLLYATLTSQVKSTFHKINIHDSLTPTDVKLALKPAIEQAIALRDTFKRKRQFEDEDARIKHAIFLENERKERSERMQSQIWRWTNFFKRDSSASLKSFDHSVLHSSSKMPYVTVSITLIKYRVD